MTKSKKTLAILAIVVILIAAAAIAVNGNAAVARLAGQEVTAGDIEGYIGEAEYLHQIDPSRHIPTHEEAAIEAARLHFVMEELTRLGYEPSESDREYALQYVKMLNDESSAEDGDETAREFRDMEMQSHGWTAEEFDAAMEERYYIWLFLTRYANEHFDGNVNAAYSALAAPFDAELAAEQGEASLGTEPGASSGDTELEPTPEPTAEQASESTESAAS